MKEADMEPLEWMDNLKKRKDAVAKAEEIVEEIINWLDVGRDEAWAIWVEGIKKDEDPVGDLRKLGFKFGKAEFDGWKPENRNLI